ncbi:hypothetical protein AB1Y20_020635 [Prymnesium parvum]
MGDSDLEDDDLDAMWDELGDDDDELTANVSGNLAEDLGLVGSIVHKDDADEGRVTWVAPTFHGLENSDDVTKGTRHWYHDEAEDLSADAVVAATGDPPPAYMDASASSAVSLLTSSASDAPPQNAPVLPQGIATAAPSHAPADRVAEPPAFSATPMIAVTAASVPAASGEPAASSVSGMMLSTPDATTASGGMLGAPQAAPPADRSADAFTGAGGAFGSFTSRATGENASTSAAPGGMFGSFTSSGAAGGRSDPPTTADGMFGSFTPRVTEGSTATSDGGSNPSTAAGGMFGSFTSSRAAAEKEADPSTASSGMFGAFTPRAAESGTGASTVAAAAPAAGAASTMAGGGGGFFGGFTAPASAASGGMFGSFASAKDDRPQGTTPAETSASGGMFGAPAATAQTAFGGMFSGSDTFGGAGFGSFGAPGGNAEDSNQRILRVIAARPTPSVASPVPIVKKQSPEIREFLAKADALGYSCTPITKLVKSLGTSIALRMTSRRGVNVYQTATYFIDNFPLSAIQKILAWAPHTMVSRGAWTASTYSCMRQMVGDIIDEVRYDCAGLTRALRTPSEAVIRVVATLLPGMEITWSGQEVDRIHVNFMFALADETGEIHPPKDAKRREVALGPGLEQELREQVLLDLAQMSERGYPLSPGFLRQLGEEGKAQYVEAMLHNAEVQRQSLVSLPAPLLGKKRRLPQRKDTFEVDEIVGEEKKTRHYLVRWKGYHPSWEVWRAAGEVGGPVETWEPERNVWRTEAFAAWQARQTSLA